MAVGDGDERRAELAANLPRSGPWARAFAARVALPTGDPDRRHQDVPASDGDSGRTRLAHRRDRDQEAHRRPASPRRGSVVAFGRCRHKPARRRYAAWSPGRSAPAKHRGGGPPARARADAWSRRCRRPAASGRGRRGRRVYGGGRRLSRPGRTLWTSPRAGLRGLRRSAARLGTRPRLADLPGSPPSTGDPPSATGISRHEMVDMESLPYERHTCAWEPNTRETVRPNHCDHERRKDSVLLNRPRLTGKRGACAAKRRGWRKWGPFAGWRLDRMVAERRPENRRPLDEEFADEDAITFGRPTPGR